MPRLRSIHRPRPLSSRLLLPWQRRHTRACVHNRLLLPVPTMQMIVAQRLQLNKARARRHNNRPSAFGRTTITSATLCLTASDPTTLFRPPRIHSCPSPGRHPPHRIIIAHRLRWARSFRTMRACACTLFNHRRFKSNFHSRLFFPDFSRASLLSHVV
jgi:hypothetical protein